MISDREVTFFLALGELLADIEQPKRLIEKKLDAFRKAKAEGLTDAEIEERAALRQEYLNAVMANARSVLENTYIVDEKGNKRKLRGKGEGEA